MARTKKIKPVWTPPGVENKPELGLTYQTYNTKFTSKEDARKYFKRRYEVEPEVIFFGPPDGNLIFVGPVPGSRADNVLKNKAAIQPELL